MQQHHISRNYLARAINVRFEVVDKWYNNKVEKLDLDILARVCAVLECDVTDVIEYVAGEEGAMRETLFNS
ncbi:MAG: helix-turn-helix transcriptional regulator [Firmicutes bacterium]|nr:helix-turn-helix transcriptional regulator [Bacillota bacterium]